MCTFQVVGAVLLFSVVRTNNLNRVVNSEVESIEVVPANCRKVDNSGDARYQK